MMRDKFSQHALRLQSSFIRWPSHGLSTCTCMLENARNLVKAVICWKVSVLFLEVKVSWFSAALVRPGCASTSHGRQPVLTSIAKSSNFLHEFCIRVGVGYQCGKRCSVRRCYLFSATMTIRGTALKKGSYTCNIISVSVVLSWPLCSSSAACNIPGQKNS